MQKPLMEAETVLELYDSYWFDLNYFSKTPLNNNKKIREMPSSNPEIPILPTIQTKYKSPVQKKGSIFSPRKMGDYSASPNSVLLSPKLQTIFSGKDYEDSSRAAKEIQEITTTSSPSLSSSKIESALKGNSGNNRRRRKMKGFTKSLSDLEFEELKGFIDLGFVFSEEDKDSSLATIIPGLQRLGEKNHDIVNDDNYYKKTYVNKIKEGEKNSAKSAAAIARPYLSESWEILGKKKKKEKCLMNWRFPAPNNEDEMKDHLRIWAHTVASTVR